MGRRTIAGGGSVFQRADGKWVAQLSIGGRENRRYAKRVRTTERAAKAALAELRGQRMAVGTSRLDLGSYLRLWLDETAKPSVSANTHRGYGDAIEHLEPIHHIPVAKLTPEDLEGVFNRMTRRRGPMGVPAAPKTVRNAQIMLRVALGHATARGHVARNVAALVPLRKVPRVSRDALTPERARAILAAVAGDRYEAGYALALIGLRAGEILGLAWNDVDLKRRVLRVRYQLVGSGPSARRAELKSEASEAPVPLPPFVASRLRLHRMRQRHERPVIDVQGGLVFVTPDGWGVNGSWLTKHFQQLLEEAGLPKMRLHDLRHGAATLLVDAGVHPRIAQSLLRHASSRTTLDIYSHTTAAQEREAVDVIERVMAGSHRVVTDGAKARDRRTRRGAVERIS